MTSVNMAQYIQVGAALTLTAVLSTLQLLSSLPHLDICIDNLVDFHAERLYISQTAHEGSGFVVLAVCADFKGMIQNVKLYD